LNFTVSIFKHTNSKRNHVITKYSVNVVCCLKLHTFCVHYVMRVLNKMSMTTPSLCVSCEFSRAIRILGRGPHSFSEQGPAYMPMTYLPETSTRIWYQFLPHCMECRRGLTMRFLSVVCLSNACIMREHQRVHNNDYSKRTRDSVAPDSLCVAWLHDGLARCECWSGVKLQ